MTAIATKEQKFKSVFQAKKRGTIIYNTFMVVMSFAILYPLLWMISSSFKPNSEIFATVTSLIPTTFTVENYAVGWKGFAGVTFFTFFKNSLIVAELAFSPVWRRSGGSPGTKSTTST